MNPQAGAFQPPANKTVAIKNGGPIIDSMAVVQANGTPSSQPSNLPNYLDSHIGALRDAVIDELCSLHRDVDALKRGGWAISVGPWKELKNGDNEDEMKAIRDRIESSFRIGSSQPLAIAAAPSSNGTETEGLPNGTR